MTSNSKCADTKVRKVWLFVCDLSCAINGPLSINDNILR